MPRLDATRLDAWRQLARVVPAINRQIDESLRAEWDIGLGWFDVLAALQQMGGSGRPTDVARRMRLPLSSLTRRFDRLEEDGWITRRRDVDGADLRTIDVELTPRGRNLWREMNRSYRRAVQQHVAGHLGDEDIDRLHEVISILGQALDRFDQEMADDDR